MAAKGLIRADIKVSGVAEALAKLRVLDRDVRGRSMRKALRTGAERIRSRARRKTPKGRTGDLRRGWFKDVGVDREGRLFAVVGNRAPHAVLIEFGTGTRFQTSTGRRTGRVTARPMLRPAVDEGRQRFLEGVEAEVEKILKRHRTRRRGR